MSTQSRDKLAHYIAKKGQTTYNRLGKGISSQDSNLNPQEQDTNYIDGTSDNTVTGYQPAWPVTADKYGQDPANILLYDLAWTRAKGEDAVVEMINVQKDVESENTPGLFKAYKQECSWVPESDGGGDATAPVAFSGSLKAKGDQIHGWATIVPATSSAPETCTFTETDE